MMKAGNYWVGDLCYVLDDEWDEVCALTIEENECLTGEFELSDGRRFAMYQTMYGDGTYSDQFGNKYSVDSGTIGCIFIDDIKPGTILIQGAVHAFPRNFETSCKDAVIRIGHVVIDTDEDIEPEIDGWDE